MTRKVQLVLLCEDRQQEVFARRFLEKAGWYTRSLRVIMAPPGKGSAEQFVREQFPAELHECRKHANTRLVVMIDGDNQGPHKRLGQLDKECQKQRVRPRQSNEAVAIVVPTWNIETWLAYLDGQDVDETRSNYSKLSHEGDCQRHVNALWQMCQQGKLRQPSPPSLDAACAEYKRL